MNTQEELLTTAIQIAKFVHNLYDTKDSGCENWYHGHFISGVNPFYNQTEDCLIIEGYYGIPVRQIYTPLGHLQVSGSGCGRYEAITKIIHQNIKLELICPRYQTESGCYGPFWLVTEFNGKQVPHPKIQLLPPIDRTLNVKDLVDDKILEPYAKLLNDLQKPYKSFLDYKVAKEIFEGYLGKWLKTGLIRDTKGLSLKMMENKESYDKYLKEFIEYITPDKREYVTSDKPNKVVFNLIYYSHFNDNRDLAVAEGGLKHMN